MFMVYQKILSKKLSWKLKNDFLIHTSFLAMISKFILLSRKGVYPYFGKIQWNFINWKGRLLQLPRHGRCYLCRLCNCTKSVK